MVIKTYIHKSATIIENSRENFGWNPILSLFYGYTGFSRILVQFDLNYIRSLYKEKIISDLKFLNHRLFLYNAGQIDFRTFNEPCPTVELRTAQRAQSFKLILFQIPEPWEQGRGYDDILDSNLLFKSYQNCYGVNWFEKAFQKQWGSNQLGLYSHMDFKYQFPIFHWFSKLKRMRDNDGVLPEDLTDEQIDLIIEALKLKEGKQLEPYPNPVCGIYDNTYLMQQYTKFLNKENSIILLEQEFPLGSENIDMDITHIINTMILNPNIPNNGFAIAFSPEMEIYKAKPIQTCNFFSATTSNVFAPHLISEYTDTIRDDRNNFYLDKPNRLYFYSNIGNNPTNLMEIPKCTITGNYENGEELKSEPIVKQASKGVYYIDIELNSIDPYEEKNEIESNRMFYDTWHNLKLLNCETGKKIKIPDKTLEFVTKPSDEYFMIGADADNIPQSYSISIFGIKYNEKIRRDEGIRKVFVEAVIPYTTNQEVIADNIWYKLTMDEADKEIDWCNWLQLNRTPNSNYFLLDVGSLLPHEYTIHILVKDKLETRKHMNVIKFKVISLEKDGHYN